MINLRTMLPPLTYYQQDKDWWPKIKSQIHNSKLCCKKYVHTEDFFLNVLASSFMILTKVFTPVCFCWNSKRVLIVVVCLIELGEVYETVMWDMYSLVWHNEFLPMTEERKDFRCHFREHWLGSLSLPCLYFNFSTLFHIFYMLWRGVYVCRHTHEFMYACWCVCAVSQTYIHRGRI